MENEKFDIIDENNNLLGIVKSRAEVHKNLRDWHRTTGINIINSQKQILCQKRSEKKDAEPGMWQSHFGGHLRAGETFEKNAIAELKEELGLEIDPKNLIPLEIRKNNEFKHFIQGYILRWDGDISKLKLQKEEVDEVKWFTLSELEKEIAEGKFCNGINAKIREYLEK